MEIKVTLAKSLIACKPKQKATAAALGLHKPGDTVVLNDNAANRGKINAVSHLVKVETL